MMLKLVWLGRVLTALGVRTFNRAVIKLDVDESSVLQLVGYQACVPDAPYPVVLYGESADQWLLDRNGREQVWPREIAVVSLGETLSYSVDGEGADVLRGLVALFGQPDSGGIER